MYRNSEELGRIVFVGGSPRSGTTLVQRILNHHPKVYGGPEFDFIPGIADLYQRMRDSIRSGRIARIVDERQLRETFRTLIASLLVPKAEAEGVSVLSEKTPSNVLAFEILEEIAPESKQILVIRDPRDVVNSMIEVGNRQRRRLGHTSVGFVRDIFAAVRYANQCLLAGCSFAERSKNCLVVYYEDVVANPLQEANRVYAFLGLEELQEIKLSESDFETGKDKYFQDFCPSGSGGAEVAKNQVGASRSQLSKSELSYIGSKIVSHPLISGRYRLTVDIDTGRTYWCMIKTMGQRVAQGLGRLPQSLHRKLLG
jgi:Sulfotransferase family